MSRKSRPLGSSSSAIALVAVLAITTGWNLPPSRPGHPSPGTVSQMSLDRHSSVAAERLSQRARDRAAEWAVSWDAGAARNATATPAEDDLPPLLRVRDVSLDGVRPVPAVESVPGSKPRETTTTKPSSPTRAYQGRNHFWFPAIGLSRDVVLFPCDRNRPPDNHLYRWGCAGRNNVYLLGHAYSAMKPLHDAYVQGRLKVGMVAVYADGNGRVRKYRVTEWRVVDPTQGVRWAIADQPVPSMTLQTCVGRNSEYRLNVRLVAVD